ncbi:caspase family protein [Aquibium sp. A9E412]|uniref:caspase family protein n=1 Tax=Aquibium sp. A9E412 TaxID=2976767 RepID=UPI0025B0BB90|nr:caspase family protein [Aquibium sp. A9E412]MDN2565931.1 caspase family protein [Aquibium sp. A9E412]
MADGLRAVRRHCVAAGVWLATVATATAAECTAEFERLERFAAGVSVAFEAADTVVAGEPLTVRWQSAVGLYEGDARVYLVLVSIDAVRFGGNGFVPFPGGTPGPAGIGFAEEWMRAVTPLHVAGNPSAGRYAVKPYREGRFGLSWAVVASTACGERQLTEVGTHRVSVEARRAQVVVQDLYDPSRPQAAIASRDGRHRLLVFDGHYQVFDTATGAKILDRAGHCPDFSPSGRFVAALSGAVEGACRFFTAGSSMPKFEVVDLLSGGVVARPDPPALWAYGDAFLVVPAKWWKMLQPPGHVISLLVDPDPGSEARPRLEFLEGGGQRFALADGMVVSFDADGSPGLDAFNLVTERYLVGDAGGERSFAEDHVEATRSALARAGRGRGAGPAGLADDPQVAASHLRYIDDLAEAFDNIEEPERIAARSPDHPAADVASVRGALFDGADAGALMAAGAARGAVGLAPQATGRTAEGLAGTLLGLRFAPPDPARVFGGNLNARMFEVDAMALTDDEKAALYFGELEAFRAAAMSAVAADVPRAQAIFDQALGCWPSGDRLANNLTGAWRFADTGGRTVWLTHAACQGIGTVGNLAISQFDLFVADGLEKRHYNLLFDRRFYEAAQLPDDPPNLYRDGAKKEAAYGALRAAGGDGLAKLDQSVHQRAENTDVAPVFAAGRFILLPVGEELYIIDHRALTLRGPVPLTTHSHRSRFLATEDGRHFLQVGADGSLAIHRLATGEAVLRGRYVDDEMVIFDEAGHYVATPEGAQFAHLRFAGRPELYSLAQMGDRLNRPDLLRAVLDGAPVAAEPAAAPPRLAVARDAAAEGAGLAVEAASPTGLAELRVYRDGALAARRPLEGASFSGAVDAEAAAGARWLTLVAVDAAGAQSRPRSVPLAPQGDRGRLFAVAVGTDRYDSAALAPLRYAAADAQRFADALRTLDDGLYAGVELVGPFIDARGLDAAFAAAFQRLSQVVTPRDTVMFFVAGHGVRDAAGRFFLATRDTALDALDGTALAWDGLAGRLATLDGRIFVFLDACHSGSVGDATNDGAVAALVGDGALSVTVLAASKGRQFSLESPAADGGYFTVALAEAIARRGEPGVDLDGSGTLDLDELYFYLKKRVMAQTDGRQTPWIARSRVVGKAPLF